MCSYYGGDIISDGMRLFFLQIISIEKNYELRVVGKVKLEENLKFLIVKVKNPTEYDIKSRYQLTFEFYLASLQILSLCFILSSISSLCVSYQNVED